MVFTKIPSEIKKYIIFFIIIVIVGSLLSSINSGYRSFLYLVYSLINLALVIYIFKREISEYVPLVILYIFSIFVISQSILIGNINEIFPETSRNSISWIGLVLCSLYYMISILNEKKPKGPFPIFILVIICIIAEGRSGIFASIIFFFCYFLFNYTIKNKISYQIIKNFILLSIFLYFVLNYASFFNEKLTYFKNAKLQNNARLILIKDYMESLDLVNIFAGVNLSSIPAYKRYNYNPHNSYIKCHIQFGIMAVLMIIFFIYTFIKGIQNKENFFLLSIYGCLLLRIMTDKLVFVENFDFVIYFASILVHVNSDQLTHDS
jgi:hypothetical protein